MIIVTRQLADTSARPATQEILLTAERRLFLKRRWRAVAADGTEFGFDLEDRLVDGAVIHRSSTHDYVIRQMPETVLAIATSDTACAALIGWKIGNLHFPIQILPDKILAPIDPAITALVAREGWCSSEVTVVYQPLRAEPHAS